MIRNNGLRGVNTTATCVKPPSHGRACSSMPAVMPERAQALPQCYAPDAMSVPACCQPAATPPPLAIGLLIGTGFLMSLGHCLGMCGPIVSAVSLARRPLDRSRWGHALTLLLYHTGRIASYGVIGAVLGLLGSAAIQLGRAAPIQGWISLVAGALMILLGLGLLGWLPTQRWVERSSVGGAVTRVMRSLLRAPGRMRLVALGVANGFLPCGPVAAVALGAAGTGEPVAGAVSMLAYGLGTIPALIALGFGAGMLPPSTRQRLYRIGAILVLTVGAQLGLRGLAALGVVRHLEFTLPLVKSVVLW